MQGNLVLLAPGVGVDRFVFVVEGYAGLMISSTAMPSWLRAAKSAL
jgi:hypothetical protein